MSAVGIYYWGDNYYMTYIITLIIIILCGWVIPYTIMFWIHKKILDKPLTEEEKNENLVKLLFIVTDELKDLADDKVSKFLDGIPTTRFSEILFLKAAANRKAEVMRYTDITVGVWVEYLLTKISDDNMPESKKKELKKEVEAKPYTLLCSRALIMNNYSPIDKLEEILEKILGDRNLKVYTLIKVNDTILKTLFNPSLAA